MSVVTDIGLRLQEGIQELKLEQQLAPAREAVARTVAAGSANFFKAMEGVRGRWMQRTASSSSNEDVKSSSGVSTPPVDITKADLEPEPTTVRPLTLSKHASVDSTASAQSQAQSPRQTFAAWGSGIGSFVSSRTTRFSVSRGNTQEAAGTPTLPPKSPPPNAVSTPSPPLVVSPTQKTPEVHVPEHEAPEMGMAL